MATGHFTAMVWKGVTQFGVGCWEANGCIVVAGCYKPHANMQGAFGARAVDDTEDEESESEEEVELAKKVEKVEVTKPSPKKEDTKPTPKQKEIHPAAKDAFIKNADENGTIGWEQLKDWLNECVKVTFKFDGYDKLISILLISLATIPAGEKERINLDQFGVILKCVEGVLDAYGEFDQDGSGNLDPFEKDAMSAIKCSKLTLYSTLEGDNGGKSMVMSFRSYFLAFLLLSKLQAVQLAREKKAKAGLVEDFSLKEWVQEQIDI